jgi:DNA-binding phage protein
MLRARHPIGTWPRLSERGGGFVIRTEAFDAARYPIRPKAQDELLNDALASGDTAYVAQALGVIARVRGMTEPASPTR